MKCFRWAALLLTFCIASVNCRSAQTPSQILNAGAAYGALSDNDLQIAELTLLSQMVAGQVISPATIMSNGAGFQALSTRDLQICVVTLLSQMSATISNGAISGGGLGITNLGQIFSNTVLVADFTNRTLYDYSQGPALQWGFPSTLVASADFEVGGNGSISGVGVLGDAVTQASYATGQFFRRTNLFGGTGGVVDNSWSLINTNGDIISSNALLNRVLLFTNGTLFVQGGHNLSFNSAAAILTNVVYTNVTLNPGAATAASFSDTAISTVNGTTFNGATIKSNDVVVVTVPALSQTNGMWYGWISNTTIYERYVNIQATTVDPAQGVFNVELRQYR